MSEDKQQKELEDLIKRKLNNKEFAFDESYWVEAKSMIDAHRKKNKKRFFIIWITLIALVATSITMLMLNNKKDTTTLTSENSNKSSLNILTHNTKLTSTKISSKKNTAKRNLFHKNKQLNSFASSKTLTSTELKKKKNKPNNYLLNHNPNSTELASRKTAIQQKEKTKQLKSRNRKTEFTFSKKSTIRLIVDDKTSPFIKANQITDIIEISPKTYSIIGNKYSYCDTCIKKSDAYLIQKIKAKQQRFFMLEAGATYFNPSSNFIANIDFTGGLKYYRFISNRTNINIGLFYSRLHQNLADRNYQSTYYSFGEINNKQSILTQRLDYLEIPLQLSVSVLKNQFINGGVSLNYLLNSGDLVKIQNSENNKTTDKKDNGYTTAINNYDIQLSIGYTYFLSKSFATSLSYCYGLKDVSDNKTFKSTTFDHNKGLRLSISYKLFR